MKVSVKTISENTGFSPATVSNALNHKAGVNKRTAEIITAEAERLGYFTKKAITRVKFVMYKKTGEIVEDTPFFPLMIAGVEQECRANGLDMTICYLDRRAADYEEQLKLLQTDLSSALIFLGTELFDEDLELVHGIAAPFVMIDYWNCDMSFNAVLINNDDSAYMATSYLIGKGHTDIGYLRGDMRIKPFEMRFSGFHSALRQHGIPVNKDYIVTVGTTINSAYQKMLDYLADDPPLPTAFFADNDMVALGAMKAFSDKGIRIPEDISVIGFDDLTYSAIAATPLTTIRVPKQEMGREAVRRLLELVEDSSGACTKIQVCTEFVERGSVKNLMRQA